MLRDKAGQTIVEAVVVIGVVVLLVTGLVAGTTASLRSAASGRSKAQAVKYAQEAMEDMRALRDQRWSTFQAHNGYYCYGSDKSLIPASLGSCTVNVKTSQGTFIRSVTFLWDGQKMKIDVSVLFDESGTRQNVTLTTYLTQWK